jgi:hypothetical protein
MSDPPTSPEAPPVLAAQASRRRWPWIALAVAALVALGVLFQFNPAGHSFYPFCAFHRVTGLQCPGCGGLRSVHHLLHGEVVTAFRFNPLVVLALAFAAGLVVRRWIRGPRREPTPHRVQARRAWFVFAVLMVFWIVRNLPFDIFRHPTG